MRALVSVLFLAFPLAAQTFTFHVAGDEPGPWPEILSSVGFVAGVSGSAGIFVFPAGADVDPQPWLARAEQGAFLILEGDSTIARALGIQRQDRQIPTRGVVDTHNPRVPIAWERVVDTPVFSLPESAEVFCFERWKKAPLVAGFRRGAGGILWTAISPGSKGHERLPYLLHALRDLGADAPVRSSRLWAFYDPSYRSRADLDWMARRWRKAGIGGLHVAAWHFFEPDTERDARLRQLIDACHRNAISVYAWLELPHVSDQFWEKHLEWREKTALGQDAHLDWRRLMNLANPDCRAAVAAGIRELISRFDWDGINLAELYFESLHGPANAARFTPMNEDVRREFQRSHGFDPLRLFQSSADPKKLRLFLDWRANLATRLQREWLSELEALRKQKPHLDLVLTHVDDRFDRSMRDSIGADAAALLPHAEASRATFLIEDPATVWHLGPERYAEIRRRYEPLTTAPGRLAIDINIVERYQDVYPTKQQTGTELFQLVRRASAAFPRVALYFEASILSADVPFLPAAAAAFRRLERVREKLVVDSPQGIGVRWATPALVNGRLWPVWDGETVWAPPGPVVIEPAQTMPPVRILDCNAELKGASVLKQGVEFSYESQGRAFVVVNTRIREIELDGEVARAAVLEHPEGYTLVLPPGQHVVTLRAGSDQP